MSLFLAQTMFGDKPTNDANVNLGPATRSVLVTDAGGVIHQSNLRVLNTSTSPTTLQYAGTGLTQINANWYTPPDEYAGYAYEMRITEIGGNYFSSNPPNILNNWIAMKLVVGVGNADYLYSITSSGQASGTVRTAIIRLEVRNKNTLVVLDSQDITLQITKP